MLIWVKFLMYFVIKVIVVILFLLFFVVGIYGVMKVDESFDRSILVKDDLYFKEFLVV